MADPALPLRRYLSANVVALAPSAVALAALYWTDHLARRPALAAFLGIAVVTAILVQRYLESLARFARFVRRDTGLRLASPARLDRQSRGLRAGHRRWPPRSADRGRSPAPHRAHQP